MHLRKLQLKDGPNMLEWMHDNSVTDNLYSDFKSKTLSDCEKFIKKSWDYENDIHLAIASDDDEYMGTVSLKHVDRTTNSAEFAIVIRNSAMGCGYSWFGMKSIIKIAFNDLGLESVYWCVSKENLRAIRFYEKHNFHEMIDVSCELRERYKDINNLKWYAAFDVDKLDGHISLEGCKLVSIKTIPTIDAGELSFFEGNKDITFDIKRIYYISKAPEGTRRGFHAHKELKQLMFVPYGEVQLVLDDGKKREEIQLSDPSIGLVISKPIWREMIWVQKDSVLCVAASDYYDEKDYIREYDSFLNYINKRLG